MKENNDIIIYQTEDGVTRIEVRLENENVWLTQQQMAELYQTSRTNIVEHIRHIYDEQELDEFSTCRNFRQVRTEGNRQVEREIPFYNLDMIISLGYRVKSRIATNFRRWAAERLKSLSSELTREYDSGFSKRNLEYARKVYLAFPDFQIVQTRLRNLTWSHLGYSQYFQN